MLLNNRISFQKLISSGPQRNFSIPLLFGVGLFVGLSMAALYTQYRAIVTRNQLQYYAYNHIDSIAYHGQSMLHGWDDDEHSETAIETDNNEKNVHAIDGDVHVMENHSLALQLQHEIRILCMILTRPSTHRSKAIHVMKTWGKRCNKLIFISTGNDDELKPIIMNVSDNKNAIWAKTRDAFKYIYQNHLNDADWFLKAEDDTYIIVENLRFLLAAYMPSDPIWFGYKINDTTRQGYFAGGAGYVLSRDAIVRFNEQALVKKNENFCRTTKDDGFEDVEMGKCLNSVGVMALDTRDDHGRERFFINDPETHLIPGKKVYSQSRWRNKWYPTNDGLDCCSDNVISFHQIRPNSMYVLDYLIYHLRPYGIIAYPQSLPKKVNVNESMILLKNSNKTK